MSFLKKIILSSALSLSLSASLVNTSFVYNDVKVLDELDIKSTYLTDYLFQKEYQKRLRHTKDRYTEKLNDAYLFVPQIKNILKENNMPSAFLYLVMAESNFKLNAASNKSAKGLWQFIPQTAKHYGLETNSYIDERMDIIKSTKAAVEYLQKLHDMFGKWYLAAVAYNCGEGRVIEGLTRATIDMYCEDTGYDKCRKDPKIIKFRNTIKDYQSKRVRFSHLNRIYKEVKKWNYNPDIDELLLVQKGIDRQYLPAESRDYIRKIVSLALMNNSDFLLKDENSHLLNRGLNNPIASIEVKGGVLLSNIAKLIGEDKKRLKELNGHIRKNMLPLDKEHYTVYIPYSKLSRYKLNKDQLEATVFENYVVKAGDTLGSIGRKFDIDYRLIKKHNNMKKNILSINQELIIPIDPETYKRDVDYVVRTGDTLGKIAENYKVDLKKLMKDNNLKTSMIRIGEKLVIKYR